MGSTYIEWMVPSSNGQVQSWIGATVALTDATGLLFYDGAFGWGGEFHDFKNFHGRMVAQTVGVGSPEVTARVTTIEDLDETAGLLDSTAGGGDPQLLETVVMDEATARKNLEPSDPAESPGVRNTSQGGVATAEIVVDCAGKVREVGPVISPNSNLVDVARKQMEAMRFKPFLQDGLPVQVITRITLSFEANQAG